MTNLTMIERDVLSWPGIMARTHSAERRAQRERAASIADPDTRQTPAGG